MSKALLWKNYISGAENGTRMTFIPGSSVKDGPKDDIVEIVGMKTVKGDQNRDFIIDPKKDMDAFDAVHTFLLVRQVVTMYQRALWRIGKENPFSWQWGPGRVIQVHPRAGNREKAYYSRKDQSLKFFFYKQNGKTVFTSRSNDVVLHECGHAILDALRPGYWASWQPQTSALHESFADITEMLSFFSQMDQCEAIVTHCKGDLSRKSFFKVLTPCNIGSLGSGKRGIRSADNDLILSDVSNEIREVSQVFTGAFFDILVDVYEELRNPEMQDDAATLYNVGEQMTTLLVNALLRGPPQNATFHDIAEKMISLEKNKNSKYIIRYHFESRQILGKNKVKASTVPVEIDWRHCTGCMSTTEHINAVEEGTQRKRTCLPFKPTVY
jgi:hypothetical protein